MCIQIFRSLRHYNLASCAPLKLNVSRRDTAMNSWPFSDPENVATFTVKQVVCGKEPILLVCHDAEDGGWQFLTGETVQVADAMLVGLKEIVKMDPSVVELADLPEGWSATREFVDGPWKRAKSEIA